MWKPDPARDIFNATGGWTIVHRTSDDWEVSLIRAALGRAEIPHKVDTPREDRNPHLFAVGVPVEFEEEALDVIMQVVEILNAERLDPKEADQPERSEAAPEAPVRAAATDVPIRVIAAKEGLGELVHIEGHGYEIRVGPEPYYVVPEDRWEEFTDFSAQRQEFAILLEKEYERLYRWLRAQRRFGDFLRLVESTYRGTPEEDSPEDFLRAAGWMLAVILGLAAVIGLFRWIEALTTGLPD
ncbi:MAG: hypothetical protein KatS3mg115_1424 [Candidatus Poribacteria bacterium]|nr:MAG: hypothetical protein KatS3mg115_1424 [Candidatus Poribacteria bacterium]